MPRRKRLKRKIEKAVDIDKIYDELMMTSKSFRESTPRTRETRVKRVHTLRMKKKGML